MFKRLFIFIQLFICTQSISQPIATWLWKQNTSVSYVDMEYYDGFIYVIGNFTDTIVHIGQNTFVNAGNTDFIISKLDTLGNVIWAKHYGGTGNDVLSNLSVDNNGSVYVVGSFSNQIIINNNIVFADDSMDIIFLKLNSNGAVQLAKSSGSNRNDYGIDIAVDFASNIYVLANVDTLEFAGKGCRKSATLLKYDSIGNPVWHHYITGTVDPCCAYTPRNITGMALKYSAVDSTLVIGGNFKDPIMLDSVSYIGPGTWFGHIGFSGLSDAFLCIYLAKIKTSGEWKFFRVAGFDIYKSNFLVDLCISSSGDIYFSQDWGISLSFNRYAFLKRCDKNGFYISFIAGLYGAISPSLGFAGKLSVIDSVIYSVVFQQNLSAGYNCSDYYAMKYNLNTNTSSYISIEPSNNTYSDMKLIGITGKNGHFFIGNHKYIGKACDMNCPLSALGVDPSPDVTICPNGATDIGGYSCFYATGGTPPYTYNWSPVTGLSNPNVSNPAVSGINTNMSYTVTVTDQLNNVTYDTVEVFYNTNPILITQTKVSCNSYTFNGHNYTSSGIYHDTVLDAGWCYKYYTLNLTIDSATSSFITQTAVDSFSLNGQTYFSSGIYTQTLVNAIGCDSNITLNLTIIHPMGINDYTASSILNIFPNPTRNEFTISSDSDLINGYIKVMSIHGEVIFERTFEAANNFTFDMGKYASGLYFIDVFNNQRKYHFKLLKE